MCANSGGTAAGIPHSVSRSDNLSAAGSGLNAFALTVDADSTSTFQLIISRAAAARIVEVSVRIGFSCISAYQ